MLSNIGIGLSEHEEHNAMPDSSGYGQDWIQPPVREQSIDLSEQDLIDGIYVRSSEQIQVTLLGWSRDFEKEMELMASDPDVLRELKNIQADFAFAMLDGLNEK